MSPRVGQPWKKARDHIGALDERLDARLAAGRKPRRRIVIARLDGEEITALDLGRAAFGMLAIWLLFILVMGAGSAAGIVS